MADDLRSLRAQLTACDEQIVTLLGERMRLIRRVADVKAAANLPSFDRGREGAHMDDLHARAAMANVPAEVLRDVYGTLFAASREAQREALHAGDERFSIGIIGGTSGMGSFLARIFTRAGYAVETTGVVAVSPGGPNADHHGGVPASPDPPPRHVGSSNVDVASRHDLVIVAVPISVTVDVIREIAPHVRAGACLCDVTSVKRAPLEAMLASAPETVDVVGTHPMFGPGGDDMDRQRVVVCRGRGSAGEARVRRLFESFGAEIIEATAEEHDAQMSLIQVLVHEKTMVLGSVMERLKADLPRSLQFASPIYRIELATIGRMFSQRAELYADILTSNPDGAAVSHLFEQEAAHFSRAVAMHDRETMLARFREISTFMTEFAAWAKKESDAILRDIVRHG